MAHRWQEVALSDVVRLQKGVSYKGKYLDQGSTRLLGLGTVVPGGGANVAKARQYSGPVKDSQRIQPGEVFVALTDLTQDGRVLGSPVIVPEVDGWHFAVTHHVGRVEILEPKRIDGRFLYYLFMSLQARGHMRSMARGTTVRAVSPADALSMVARLPPLRQQQAVAEVLGALDDKIELNQRMSETLEEASDVAFSSLVPDRQVDLGQIADLTKGRSYRSAQLDQQSATALVTLKSFKRGGGYRADGLKGYTGPHKPAQVVHPGEVVMACTDVTQAAEVIGRPAIVPASSLHSTLVASLDTVIVRPKSDMVSRAFLYYLARTPSFTSYAVARTTGTTVLHLKPDTLLAYSVGMPAEQALREFSAFGEGAIQRQLLAREESATLAAVRDALLPKLISGEIRIPDAERVVSEVV